MKIAICEDEPLFAEYLDGLLKKFCQKKGEEYFRAIYQSFEEADKNLRTDGNLPELIFMDIDLGGSFDGMELCKKMRENGSRVPVIFVTNLEGRAVEGYDVSALGFILKRQLDERLPIVMERYWEEYRLVHTITVTQKDGIQIVPISDILWAESEKRISAVHTLHKTYYDTRPIGRFSAELGGDFTEVFKSIYVNVRHIKSVNKDTVTLSCDKILPLSRRSRKHVMLKVMDKMSREKGSELCRIGNS